MIPDKVYAILIDLLPMIVLFSIVMFATRVAFIVVSKEKIDIFKELKMLLYIIYCFILFKLVTTTDFESFSNNFIPFKEITRYQTTSVLFFRNVIGNILLFVPFGYLICDMIYEKVGKYKIIATTSVVLITSLAIEIIQMNIGRSFDIDDIILNFIGGLVGFVIYVILHKFFKVFKNDNHRKIVKVIMFFVLVLILLYVLLKYYGVMV